MPLINNFMLNRCRGAQVPWPAIMDRHSNCDIKDRLPYQRASHTFPIASPCPIIMKIVKVCAYSER